MRILLRIGPDRARRWLADLATGLAALGAEVRLAPPSGGAPSRLLAAALELDHLLVRRGRPCGVDPVAAAAVATPADAGFRPDLVLDLTDAPPPAVGDGARVWRVLCDGRPGEDAIAAAVAAGRGPVIALVDATSGAVLERARPSLECARGLGGAMASVATRLARLLRARVAGEIAGRPRPPVLLVDEATDAATAGPLRPIVATLARDLARFVARLVLSTPHWRVGWRHVDGPGLLDGAGFDAPTFRPLPDPGLRFYADPFPVVWQGRAVVFVEDFDHRAGRGRISAVPFDETGPTGPARPVIEEPWHLSYPYPVVIDGVLHLAPESTARRDLGLYRCLSFPDRWERVATLIEDAVVSDASLVAFGGRWWMFATDEDGSGGWSDMLVIRSAVDPLGPWTTHAVDPVVVDSAAARPAGRPWIADGRLYRPVQDCSNGYGRAVAVAEVTRLDDDGFAQAIRRRVAPSRLWPGGRLHTINRVGALEVIDGATLQPRLPALTPLVAPWFRPAGGPR